MRRASGAIDTATNSSGSLRSTFRLLAREASLMGGPLGGIISQVGILTIGGSRLGAVVTGSTLALSAAAAVAYKTVGAYAALEGQQARLTNILNASGGASGLTQARANLAAGALANAGVGSVAEIRASQEALLRYRNIAGETFTKAIELAQELSATYGGDLKDSTVAFGKALSNPIDGLKELEAAGVHFSPIQEKIIRGFWNTGQAVKAQQEILKIASGQLGGAVKTSADTLGGSFTKMANSFSLGMEEIGGGLATLLRVKQVMDVLSLATDSAARNKYFGLPAEKGDRQPPGPNAALANAMRARGALAPTFDPESWNQFGAQSRQGFEGIDRVVIDLKKEAEQAGMTEVALRTLKAQHEAQAAPATAAGKAIAGLVQQIESIRAAKGISDNFREQTGALTIEGVALGKTAAAAAAYRMENEALNRERVKGNTLMPEQIANIHKEAEAYRVAAEKLAEQKLQKDIGFERSQIGRTDSEQEVYARLNAAGMLANGQIASAAAAGYGQEIRLNQALTATRGLVTDIVSGGFKDFRNAIDQGAAKLEALKLAGVGALGKIEDKLIDMATQQLVAKAFGAAIGGGSGGLLSLFGGGAAAASGSLAGVASGSAGIMVAGGGLIRGPGTSTSDSIAARLSDGEFVVNAAATAKHRPVLEAINSGRIRGFANGGFAGAMPPPRWSAPSASADRQGAPTIHVYPVAGSTMDVQQNDDGSIELIGRMIDDRIKRFDRRLPDRVHAITADPRAR